MENFLFNAAFFVFVICIECVVALALKMFYVIKNGSGKVFKSRRDITEVMLCVGYIVAYIRSFLF